VVAADLLGWILVDLPIGRGAEVAVLVNGLGATR
jgi:dihydroxyacetone kinase